MAARGNLVYDQNQEETAQRLQALQHLQVFSPPSPVSAPCQIPPYPCVLAFLRETVCPCDLQQLQQLQHQQQQQQQQQQHQQQQQQQQQQTMQTLQQQLRLQQQELQEGNLGQNSMVGLRPPMPYICDYDDALKSTTSDEILRRNSRFASQR